MRSEWWERTRIQIEELLRTHRYQGTWDPARPWQGVIRDSARDRGFWDDNVRRLRGHCAVAQIDQGLVRLRQTGSPSLGGGRPTQPVRPTPKMGAT